MSEYVDLDNIDSLDPIDEENSEENDKVNKETGIHFLNVFMCYFKKLFNREQDQNMFNNINYTKFNSTNRPMELLFEEVQKFNVAEKNYPMKIKIFDPHQIDINKCQELYILVIDNKQYKVCQTLIPLLYFVSELEWTKINWRIDPVL